MRNHLIKWSPVILFVASVCFHISYLEEDINADKVTNITYSLFGVSTFFMFFSLNLLAIVEEPNAKMMKQIKKGYIIIIVLSILNFSLIYTEITSKYLKLSYETALNYHSIMILTCFINILIFLVIKNKKS